MANDTERIIGALEANRDAVTKRLDNIDKRITNLPCTTHLERLVRMESKVDDLNDIRRKTRNAFLRWMIPFILAGSIAAFAATRAGG